LYGQRFGRRRRRTAIVVLAILMAAALGLGVGIRIVLRRGESADKGTATAPAQPQPSRQQIAVGATDAKPNSPAPRSDASDPQDHTYEARAPRRKARAQEEADSAKVSGVWEDEDARRPALPAPAPAGESARRPPPQKTGASAESASTETVAKLAAAIKSGSRRERLRAMETLAELGWNGKAASREVCERLVERDREETLNAAFTLARINRELHDLVVPLIGDDIYASQVRALKDLWPLREEARAAVPVLLYYKDSILHGSAPLLRLEVHIMPGAVAGVRDEEYPARPPAYDNNPVAGFVIETLFQIAPNDPEWEKDVGKWLSDSNPYVRETAAKLVPKLTYPGAVSRQLTEQFAVEPNKAVRTAIGQSLRELGIGGQ
jgi:hypothetical protein